jgi:hypothetical protein
MDMHCNRWPPAAAQVCDKLIHHNLHDIVASNTSCVRMLPRLNVPIKRVLEK